GSGLDSKEISFLLERFKDITRTTSPFPAAPALKGATWVEPVMVCEVNYLERREVLRHPTFLGLRLDLEPRLCTLDQPE
ncbi:MAG TPA: DNA ligase D, partial [Verrucomicrobiae bacterium]|nr:DNA ligase D [Verrucomicrobiae bacterium]